MIWLFPLRLNQIESVSHLSLSCSPSFFFFGGVGANSTVATVLIMIWNSIMYGRSLLGWTIVIICFCLFFAHSGNMLVSSPLNEVLFFQHNLQISYDIDYAIAIS